MRKREIVDGKLLINGQAVTMRRAPEVIDIEKCHGNLLGNIFVPNDNNTRSLMSVAFSKAAVPLIEPDFPIIFSTYNSDLNKANFYKKVKPNGYKELFRIQRNLDNGDPRFTIIYDVNGVIHTIESKRHLTFGEGISAYNETGAGNYIQSTASFTDSGVLCEGQNVMTAYANIISAIEDSCVVSHSYTERCKYLYVKSVPIEIKDTTIFTSLHDNPFPRFNKVKKDNIGIAINADKNYSSIISPKNHINRDRPVYLEDVGYFLGEMDIYYSMDVAEKFNHPHITKLIHNDMEYHKKIYEILNTLRVDHKLNINALKFIDDYEYRFIDRASIREGSQEIDKLKLIFYFYKETKLEESSKISGSHGDKVTVGHITGVGKNNPNYVDQFGRTIELLKPSPGIVNRTNSGQSTEHTINFMAFRGLKELQEQGASRTVVEKFIIDFCNHICKANAIRYKLKFKEDKFLWKRIRDEYEHIYLALNPFYYDLNISNYDDFLNVIKGTNPSKFIEDDDLLVDIFHGYRFVGRGMVAPVYIRRAKQESKSKESVRAIDDEGSDGNNKKTDRGQRSSNNPVKSSEKDKANQASVFNKRETRMLEQKNKMIPMIAFDRQIGVILKG